MSAVCSKVRRKKSRGRQILDDCTYEHMGRERVVGIWLIRVFGEVLWAVVEKNAFSAVIALLFFPFLILFLYFFFIWSVCVHECMSNSALHWPNPD